MNQRFQRGPQGVRHDRYSGSKTSNWGRFQPWHAAMEKVYDAYEKRLEGDEPKPLIVAEPPHPDFMMPVTREEVAETLARIPDRFTDGLVGVFLLRGSRKHATAASLFCFGTYWRKCVFIAPYPRRWLRWWVRRPKPHYLLEYRRAGAEIREDDGDGVEIRFNEASLRKFYLRDVLAHEIGHHVDGRVRRTNRQAEAFADWFATEYGYKRTS